MGPRLFAPALSGLIAGAFACWAGAAALTIGDRVDAAIPGGGKGTIIEIGAGVPYAGYYKIHFDGLHARAPAEGMWVDPKRYTVKALGSNGAPIPEAAPAPRLANAAARPIADDGKPGSQEARFKALIRSRYPAVHGVTKDVEFHSLQIRPQARYEHVYSTNGRGHVYSAWPVITSYTVTEHYQGEDVISDYDGKYWCFEDVNGEWVAVQAGEFRMSSARHVKK